MLATSTAALQGLALDPRRLDHVELPHVGRLPVAEVDTDVLVRVGHRRGPSAGSMSVLIESNPPFSARAHGMHFERLGERLDRELLPPADGREPTSAA